MATINQHVCLGAIETWEERERRRAGEEAALQKTLEGAARRIHGGYVLTSSLTENSRGVSGESTEAARRWPSPQPEPGDKSEPTETGRKQYSQASRIGNTHTQMGLLVLLSSRSRVAQVCSIHVTVAIYPSNK